MANSLFSALTLGTKFNKRKHGSTMKLFNEGSQSGSSQSLFDGDDFLGGCKKVKSESSVNYHDESGSAEEYNAEADLNSAEEVNAFRNRLRIKVKGDYAPDPISAFKDMDISQPIKFIILKNIESYHWKEPTPIQMQAIPAMLSGRDVLAAAPTGSGKTAAFVIPVLSKLESSKKAGIRAILLAPTRELAEQIHRETVRLSAGKKLKICLLRKSVAATALSRQDKSALAKFDLLVSTPMRLLALIRADAVDLSRLEVICLDEVDKLFELDSGTGSQNNDPISDESEFQDTNDSRSSFLNQIDEILSSCPQSTLQRGLFSATIGPQVQELAGSFLNNPLQISIGVENAGASTINQKLVFVGREEGKLLAIRQLVQEGLKPPVLIFLQNKDRAKELFRELVFDGINVDIIHSERTQQQREEVIRRFRVGEIWVLICTDLMARGVDFKGVKMVINFDLPQSAVAYIHRIGRTGRAGQTGDAVTFFTEADIARIRPIVNVMKLSGSEVPEWLLHVKQMSTKDKRSLRRKAPERRSISTGLRKGK